MSKSSPKLTPTTTTTTTTNVSQSQYRFAGLRYQLQGPSTMGPSEVIPEETSLFAFPRTD